MKRLKLKLLLNQYKKEIANGNYKHKNDMIATMVLLDYSHPFHYKLNDDMYDVTLESLMHMCPSYLDPNNRPNKYEIPTMKDIKLIRESYKKDLKGPGIPVGTDDGNAALTWVEMMIHFGMIAEGQVVDPAKFVLTDFMTDERLITMFEANGLSITDYKRAK